MYHRERERVSRIVAVVLGILLFAGFSYLFYPFIRDELLFLFPGKTADGGEIEYLSNNYDWEPEGQKISHEEEINAYMKQLFPSETHLQSTHQEANGFSVTVHILPPSENRDYFVLYTTGMSDYAMPTDDPQEKGYCYSELMMFLPKDWVFGSYENAIDRLSKRYAWPVELMQLLAVLPHEQKMLTVAGCSYDHAKPLGNGSQMSGSLLLYPPSFEGLPDIRPLRTKNQSVVYFHWVFPLYPSELQHITDVGLASFLSAMESKTESFILDPQRPALV